MVKPVVLGLAAIPGIIAVMIAVPMLTQTEIPFSAATPNDRLEIEYSKHQITTISFGVTERVGSQKSEVLKIRENGDATYTVVESGQSLPEKKFKLDDGQMLRLTAFIKETGIVSVPTESFPVREGATDYEKSILRISLNGEHKQINWPNQTATDSFIPPLIGQLEVKLDEVLDLAGE